jgi:hypothetical protein
VDLEERMVDLASEPSDRPRGRPLGRAWATLALHREVIVLGATAFVACAVVVLLSRPGYLSRDSHDQLEQARSLVLTDHHPVAMSLLWHCLDQLIPGPLGMLIFMNVVFWAGLAALFLTFRRPLLARVVAMLGVGFFPPVFAIEGAIWKDTLMQAALIAGAGCFAVFLRTRQRWLLWLGLLACVFASVTRHNGVAAVWPFLMLPWLGSRRLVRLKWFARLLAAAGAALVSTVVVTVLVLQLLGRFTEREALWQMIATFDLAGISVNTGHQMFERGSPALLPGTTVRELRRCYRTSDHLSLYYGCNGTRGKRRRPVLHRLSEPAELASLAANWRRAVLAEPLGYLRHRTDVYRRAIGLTSDELRLGYGSKFSEEAYPLSSTARRVQDSVASLASTPLFRVWIYLVLAAGAAFAAVPFYRRTGSALPLVFAGSSLSYSLSLFFGTGAGDYRYSVWSILASVLALLAFAATPHGRGALRLRG